MSKKKAGGVESSRKINLFELFGWLLHESKKETLRIFEMVTARLMAFNLLQQQQQKLVLFQSGKKIQKVLLYEVYKYLLMRLCGCCDCCCCGAKSHHFE